MGRGILGKALGALTLGALLAGPARAQDGIGSCAIPQEPTPLAEAFIPPPPSVPAPQVCAPGREREMLQCALEDRLHALHESGAIAPYERIAVGVYDPTTGERIAGINTREQMQQASLLKPLVALGVMRLREQGEWRCAWDREAFKAMLSYLHGDAFANAQTNKYLDCMGGPRALEALLKRDYASIFDGVGVVEKIPPGGRTYLNTVSADEMGRLFASLARDELPGAQEMLRSMRPLKGRLAPRVMRMQPSLFMDADIRRKTGTTGRAYNEVSLITDADGRSYIFAFMMDSGIKGDYGAWKARGLRTITVFSSIVRGYAGPQGSLALPLAQPPAQGMHLAARK